jgi:glycopeptide antibiotics resistance protein
MKYLFLVSIPVLVIGWEVFQLYNLIPGTYSVQDIILGGMGALIGFLIGHNSTKLYNHENIK